jgi:predicted nucleic acid-binding protein
VALYYLDTSALVKRYVVESGTSWVTTITDAGSGNEIWTARLAGPELIAALFRKVRTREIRLRAAQRAGNRFRLEWQRNYLVVELTSALADAAMDLAE